MGVGSGVPKRRQQSWNLIPTQQIPRGARKGKNSMYIGIGTLVVIVIIVLVVLMLRRL